VRVIWGPSVLVCSDAGAYSVAWVLILQLTSRLRAGIRLVNSHSILGLLFYF